MVKTTQEKVLQQLLASKKGTLFFTADLLQYGSTEAVQKSISRLVDQDILIRLGNGIFLYPEYDRQLGVLYPSMEQIAKAIADKDKARIIPTGSMALYNLGLSTQIPMNAVYLTDGVRRKINLGKNSITFKIATPKNFAMQGKKSSTVVQALRELGAKQVDQDVLKTITYALSSEDLQAIRHDAKLAPAWIAQILYSIAKQFEDDRVATTK